MFYRKLGKSDIKVSAMGLGCWAIGGPWTIDKGHFGWGDVNDDQSLRSLHLALDLGINFFDTAPNYGAGHSEYLLGQAFSGKRTEVIIATKFGTVIHEGPKEVEQYQEHKELLGRLHQDCENSLRRLQTDYIDLFQFHLGTYPLPEAEEVRHELEKLVSEGKIRYYAWSTDDLDCAKLFASGENCAAIQHRLNILKDAPEMLNLCGKYGLASINRGPLGRGLLTGKYNKDTVFPDNDNRNRQKFREQWTNPILDKLDDLKDVLTSGGRTLAQGALGWIWGRSEITIPIPGFKSEQQVRENAHALELGPLSEKEMDQIDQILNN